MTIGGTTNISATGNVYVDHAQNDFQGAVTLAGRDVRIRDQDTLVLEPTGTGVLALRAEASEIVLKAGTYDTSAGVDSGVFLGWQQFYAPHVRLEGATTLRARQSIELGGAVLGPGALTIDHNGYDAGGTTTAGGSVSFSGPLGVDAFYTDPATSSPMA